MIYTGDFECALYHTAVSGGHGVVEAARLAEEHVRQRVAQDDMLRDGGVRREEREAARRAERGERVLCCVANDARNVVLRARSRRQ